jgi:hypothetical protein
MAVGGSAVLVGLLLGAVNLYWGDLNQDEGWYLYAARQVAEGRLPYLDFAFTQGPMLPLVYAAAEPLVDRWGVGGGRLFTLLLGMAGSLLAAWTAARASPRGGRATGALVALILLTCNVYQSYFTVVVKTYSLTGLFLAAGLLALSYAQARLGKEACFASGALLALAAGTRISAGMALPAAGIALLLARRRVRPLGWVLFGAGGALGLASWSLPFHLLAPDGFRFALFEYHAGRTAGSVISQLVYKAGFLSRFVQGFAVAFALGASLVLLRRFRRAEMPAAAGGDALGAWFNRALWAVGGAITLLHLAAPFPYEDYQVFVFPVFAAALGAAAARAAAPAGFPARARWAVLSVFAASVLASFSSPVNQGWVVRGRDRIWWRLKEQPALQQLREVGLWLAEMAGPGGELLTQDPYLAVEAGLRVPPGLEMGPFSCFPDLPRERARALRVINREMLQELLATSPAPVAAFSGYGLSIASPQVTELAPEDRAALWEIVERRYEEVCRVPDFGQAFTALRILVRKDLLEHFGP